MKGLPQFQSLLLFIFCIVLQSYSKVKILEDIEIGEDELHAMTLNKASSRWTSRPWGTTIEYYITDNMDKLKIKTALGQIEAVVTCLKFKEIKELSSDFLMKEFILFEAAKPGCFSQLGRQKGRPTRVNLNGCDVIVIKHEVMHSLGFIHEHMRPDRDDFVKIVTDKISSEILKNNVRRWDGSPSFNLYTPYDYFSIMHYKSEYEGVTVIEAHNPNYQDKMRTQKDMSPADEIALNQHFNCPTITLSQYENYMQFYEHSIYHEHTQWSIEETEASKRSYLLYPYRLLVETSREVDEMYQNLAGEYRKLPGKELKNKPVWEHIKHESLKLSSSGDRWVLEDNGKRIAQSPITTKNMLETSPYWEYFDTKERDWIEGDEDVYINLFPKTEGNVLLISGVFSEGKSVEVFDPNNPSFKCDLPDLTVGRSCHAALGLTVCGGYNKDAQKSCETLEGGEWKKSQLKEERHYPFMWKTPDGKKVVWNYRNSEVLQEDGSTVYGRRMHQHT